MDIVVRPAKTEDATHACNVLRRSIVECCQEDHQGESEALDAWLHNKTTGDVRSWIQSPDLFSWAAVVEAKIVGFSMSSRSGNVLLCYLVPEVRHMGVGKAMLKAIGEQAKADGINALHLESTKTARSFYLRNGFVECGAPIAAFGMKSYPMKKTLVE